MVIKLLSHGDRCKEGDPEGGELSQHTIIGR